MFDSIQHLLVVASLSFFSLFIFFVCLSACSLANKVDYYYYLLIRAALTCNMFL